MNHPLISRFLRIVPLVPISILIGLSSGELNAQTASVWDRIDTFNKQVGSIRPTDFANVGTDSKDRPIGWGRCCGKLESPEALQWIFGWTADVVDPPPLSEDAGAVASPLWQEVFQPGGAAITATTAFIARGGEGFGLLDSGRDPGNPGGSRPNYLASLISVPYYPSGGAGGIFPITGTGSFFFGQFPGFFSFGHNSGNGQLANGQTAQFGPAGTVFSGGGSPVPPTYPLTGDYTVPFSITGSGIQNQAGGIRKVQDPVVEFAGPGGNFTVGGQPGHTVDVKYKNP